MTKVTSDGVRSNLGTLPNFEPNALRSRTLYAPGPGTLGPAHMPMGSRRLVRGDKPTNADLGRTYLLDVATGLADNAWQAGSHALPPPLSALLHEASGSLKKGIGCPDFPSPILLPLAVVLCTLES